MRATWLVLRGNSMVPTLKPLDVLVVATPLRRSYRKGDILAYSTGEPDCFVAHRVVAASSRGFVTRGDANVRHDVGAVPGSAILGRVVAVLRGGKLLPRSGGAAGELVAASCGIWLRLRTLIRAVARRSARALGRGVLAGSFRGQR